MQSSRHHGHHIIMELPCRGLPWPEVNGQRDLKNHPSPRDSASGFFVSPKNLNQDKKTMSIQPHNRFRQDGRPRARHCAGCEYRRSADAGLSQPVSYAKTLETGFVTFWSRTRQKLWMKAKPAATACAWSPPQRLRQRHAVISRGCRRRRLVCHEGTVSCFTKPLTWPAQTSIRRNKEITRG